MGREFEWDEPKAQANRGKHGVSFELARRAFDDPFAMVEQDRIEGNEYRWQTIGMAGGVILLMVANGTTALKLSELFRRDAPNRMKRDAMNRIVRTSYDTENPPPLSELERAELERLAAMSDDDIDTSDIPEMKFENAFLFRDRHLYKHLFKPIKQSTTVRIDADVLLWLRAKGRGYQTRINAILREAMAKEGG